MQNLTKYLVVVSATLTLFGSIAIGDEPGGKFVGVPVALESLCDEAKPLANEQAVADGEITVVATGPIDDQVEGESTPAGDEQWLVTMAEFSEHPQYFVS